MTCSCEGSGAVEAEEFGGGGLLFVSGGEGDRLAWFGEPGDGEGGGCEVPGVHGADSMLADERECLFFDLVFGGAEHRDRPVECEVGVEQGEQTLRVAAA